MSLAIEISTDKFSALSGLYLRFLIEPQIEMLLRYIKNFYIKGVHDVNDTECSDYSCKLQLQMHYICLQSPIPV